jgi:hypothetical protein
VFDAENKNNPESKVYNYTETNNTENINSYDVIYLCGLKDFSENEIGNIRKFINAGKGVFIFPSENINADSYNKISTFKITKPEIINNELSIKEINAESPLFEGLFKTNTDEVINGSSLGNIFIKSYYTVIPAEKSSPLITLRSNNSGSNTSIGNILLTEDPNLLISSVSADETLSDFPRHSLFSPIILRSAAYLSMASGINQGTMLTERDTLESNPELMLESVLKTSLDLTGIKHYSIIHNTETQNLERIISDNRTGKSLWNYALAASLLFLVFELFLIFYYKVTK